MAESSVSGSYFAGVEVLETGLRAVCVSPDGELLQKAEIGEPSSTQALIDFLESMTESLGTLKGAGIASMPSCDAIAAGVSNDLMRMLGSKPHLVNSAIAGIYGELKAGAGRGARDVFYATLGTPVSAALVLDGRVWEGSAGLPCEFGSLVIEAENKSIEDFASDESILRRTRNRFSQDQTSSLETLDESRLTVAELVEEALKGDDLATMMLERTGRFAGMGVATVINLLNVQKVIIGGAIVQEGTSVIDGVRAGAKDRSAPASFEATEIVPAELGVFAAAVGSALLAISR